MTRDRGCPAAPFSDRGALDLVRNATGLGGMGLAGALIVHLLAYHAPPTFLPSSAPVRAGLVVVVALALLSPLLALVGAHRIGHLDRTLDARLRQLHIPSW